MRLAALTVFTLLTLIAVGGRDAATATTLAPTQGVTLSDSATSANAQVTVSHSLAAPDSWPKVAASFIPPDFTVAADGSVPNGALVSTVQTASSYTNNNGPCSSSTFVSYSTQDASTDTSITVALPINGATGSSSDAFHPSHMCNGASACVPTCGLPEVVERFTADPPAISAVQLH